MQFDALFYLCQCNGDRATTHHSPKAKFVHDGGGIHTPLWEHPLMVNSRFKDPDKPASIERIYRLS